VRVTVVLHLTHAKVWVSTPLSLGAKLGTTRVSRIGLLQIGHFGASVAGSTGEIMGRSVPIASGKFTLARYQRPSRCLTMAGLSGFLILSQSPDGPDL
jgi:hypothetical protein